MIENIAKVKKKCVISIRKLLSTLYLEGIKELCKIIGIHDVLTHVYDKMNSPINYRETQQFEINNINIEVETKTVNQSSNLLEYLNKESPVIRRILNNVDKDTVFYDIGAFYGAYSCIIAKHEQEAEIHAFEPGESRFKHLNQTIDRNEVAVTPHNIALGTENSMTRLKSNGVISDTQGQENIVIFNADNYIKDNIEPPTMVKIDVEGKELDVIKGMSESLLNQCERLYCEVHTQKGIRVSDVKYTLQKLSFSVQIISERGSTIHIEATSSGI